MELEGVRIPCKEYGDRYLSVMQLARARNCSRVAVHYAIKQGHLPAVHLGEVTIIPVSAANNWFPMQGRGRPRKQTPDEGRP